MVRRLARLVVAVSRLTALIGLIGLIGIIGHYVASEQAGALRIYFIAETCFSA